MQHLFKISGEKKINFFESINVFFLLSLSGINFFNDNDVFLFFVFSVNVIFFIAQKQKIDNGFLGFLLFFIFLTIAQVIWFSDGNFESTMGFFLRLFIAYFVLKNSSNFILTFLNLLLFLSLAAIFFYVFFLVFPSVEDFLFAHKHFWDYPGTYEYKKSLIIYNIFKEPLFGIDSLGLFGLPRNSGPFWEPGAFAGYLAIGIAFEMALFREYSWRVFFLLSALLTTFSTTGYLVIGLFFLLYFIFLDTNKKRKLLMIPLLLAVFVFMLFNLDFLAEKVISQVQGFNEGQVYASQTTNDSRIGSAILDFADFERSPIFGTGQSDETRYGKNEELFMRTNGVTDILVRLGIVGFVFICWNLFLSLKRFFIAKEVLKPHTTTGILIFTLFFVSLSETYFILPFFWSLFLLQYAEIPDLEIYVSETSDV
jgi:hypothetical protein